MSADPSQLARDAQALRAAGRLNDAIGLMEQIVAALPRSAVAEHNLAAALGDLGRWGDAERHIRQALAKGGDAPESWLILARATMHSQPAQAEQAFEEAIRRRPAYGVAHRDLAQLRWMMSGDLRFALARLDDAIKAQPSDPMLHTVKAQVLDNVGRTEEAHALLMHLRQSWPNDALLATMTAESAVSVGDSELAVSLGAEAVRLSPEDPAATIAYIDACLAHGMADRASDLAGRLRSRMPDNQHAIALQALAWRLLGDARYGRLYDYQSLVMPLDLSTPAGWPNLGAYLIDLAAALTELHAFQAHPFDQSIKHGTQAANILDHDHPALRALPSALDPPIRTYLSHLGTGADPLRARNSGSYAIQGIWSIRMRAGGFHVNHIHPDGWISSACYVTVPEHTSGKEGWLKLGEPRLQTKPPSSPEHFVEPRPGRLVLFPSYMWHGTVPFTGEGVRTTFALDIIPA